MNSIILTMSFTGSFSFLLYIFIRTFFRRYISARYLYRMLKITMLFFLLPAAPLGYEMRLNFYELFGYIPNFDNTQLTQIMNDDTIYISANGDISIPFIYKVILGGLIIWALFFLFLMGRQLFIYVKYKKYIDNAKENVPADLLAQSENLCQVLGIKKSIQIHKIKSCPSALTIGLISPQIILPDENLSQQQLDFIFRHELLHIKSRDFLLKLTGLLVIILHWFNPAAYFLFRELSVRSECACDEAITDKLKKSDIITYGNLILEMSFKKSKEPEQLQGMPVSAFSTNNKKILKERIYYMKTKKHDYKYRSLLTTASVIVFSCLSVLPAFAYTPPYVTSGLSDALYESYTDKNAENYIVDDMDAELAKDTASFPDAGIQTDLEEYYLDEKGQLYEEAAATLNPDSKHTHQYVSSTRISHVKNSSGGCTKKYYSFKRCKLCNAKTSEILQDTVTKKKCND